MVISQIICSLALKPKKVPSLLQEGLPSLIDILEREPEVGHGHCRIS
jgi:hypothetical protein